NPVPPSSGQVKACVAGQMLLQGNGSFLQQHFSCQALLVAGVKAYALPASSASDHSYADAQIAIEAAARASADSTETAARQSADRSEERRVGKEGSTRAAADADELTRATAAETSIGNSVSLESARAITTDTA